MKTIIPHSGGHVVVTRLTDAVMGRYETVLVSPLGGEQPLGVCLFANFEQAQKAHAFVVAVMTEQLSRPGLIARLLSRIASLFRKGPAPSK